MKAPKKHVEEFIQEQLYIEEYYYVPNEVAEKNKSEEEVERGVIIIDLM